MGWSRGSFVIWHHRWGEQVELERFRGKDTFFSLILKPIFDSLI